MSAVPHLRAYAEPDHDNADSLQSDSATFRCDRATIRQVLDWYEQDPSRKTGSPTAETERRRIWRICRDAMGDNLVLDCKPFHLLSLINAQKDIDSNNTRKRWNTTIQRPFNRAEKLGLIIKNPFRGLSFPEGDDGRDWTAEEFSKVMRGANIEFRRLIIGLRLSGLRPHEGCDLQWSHIRYELGQIRIEDHKTRHRTKVARCLPLNDPLIKLFEWIKKQNYPGGHVFRTKRGRRWTRPYADCYFLRLREKLGLPDDLKLHGCRHTFGTHAIINGCEPFEVMQLMGHTDIRTTQRYVHLANKTDHLAGSMNKAVQSKPRAKPKAPANRRQREEYTPLFDGLE